MAADELYTANQELEDLSTLSSEIRAAILELGAAFPNESIQALHWNQHYVAVPLEVSIDLPTRGPVGDIDMHKQEPIFLLLHRRFYPHRAPSAWSNRRDFPASQLPHLNPTRPESPANFCLHRGNLDDWFAEHTVVDLVHRVRSWLRDAARDRLIRKEDGFEFTRIVGALGYAIYEPRTLTDLVCSAWREDGKAGFRFLWYDLLKNPSKDPLLGQDTYAIRLTCPLQANDHAKPLEVSSKLNSYHSEENQIERAQFGVMAWPSKERVVGRYFTELPDTLGQFIDWCEEFGIPIKSALQGYLTKELQLLSGVPVTLAIPRPQRLIGSRTRLELLNFIVSAGGDHRPKDGAWDLDAEVMSMGHRAPLTRERARYISSFAEDTTLGRILFLGCGAVGSKLALHLAKSGQTDLSLVDYDELSPHNMVRHGLLHDSTGRNKAEALKAHTWLVDASASSVMLNALVETDLPDSLSCCRCEIADHGRLGVLSVEGRNRNPRLDDLQVFLFDMALRDRFIAQWLQNNKVQREQQVGSPLEEINVGISCSSETMRLSDELVSLHSASFATGFRRCATTKVPDGAGRLQVSQYDEDGSLSNVVQHWDIPPGKLMIARNDPSWQVRLKYGLAAKMQELLRRAKPDETGGLLIGVVNSRRRIIYVARILSAPADSMSAPYAFVRGVLDVPETVSRIQELTGGMLGYVGEWHTHPMGGPDLSAQDRCAVAKIRRNLDSISLPTHVMIVTTRGFYSHVFSKH